MLPLRPPLPSAKRCKPPNRRQLSRHRLCPNLQEELCDLKKERKKHFINHDPRKIRAGIKICSIQDCNITFNCFMNYFAAKNVWLVFVSQRKTNANKCHSHSWGKTVWNLDTFFESIFATGIRWTVRNNGRFFTKASALF